MQLPTMQHHTIFIVKIAIHRTNIYDHLTISAKGIMTGRNQSIGFALRNIYRGIFRNTPETFKARTHAAKIVRTINIVNAACSLAILNNVVITVQLINTICNNCIFDQYTIFIKNVPICRSIRVILDEASTRIHIRITTKIVGLAIQFDPHTSIVARAIAIASAGCIHNPSALRSTVLIEGILDTVDGLLTNIQFEVGACVAVQAVSILPAGLQHAIDGVVQLAVHLEDAGAGSVDLATAFISANKLVANDLVVVLDLDLGNDGAPIHDGLTSFAVGAVLVACLGSGSFLVQNGQLCIMNVVGRRNSSQLGSNVDRTTEGNLVDLTVDNIALDVDNGHIAVDRQLFLIYIVITIPGPDAHRDTDNGTGLSLCTANSLNGHGQNFGNFVILEGSNKTVGNHSALGFPLVSIVQLQLYHHLVDFGQVCHIQVDVVNRLCLCSFARIIMAVQLYNSIAGNGEGTGDLHGVAQFILNLKCNSMNACTQRNVTLGGQRIAIDRRSDFNAIHKNLTGGQIQSSVICNSCRECHLIAGNHSAIIQRHSRVRSGISGSSDGGQHSIIHSRAIVQSDIIDVESQLSSCGGLDISTDERRRAAVSCSSVGIHGRKIQITRNVNRHIHPAGFRNICLSCGVQVGPLAGCSRSKHEVVLVTTPSLTIFCTIQLGLECQAGSAYGNIDPHTQSGRQHTVLNIAEHNTIIGIKQNIIRPACKGSIGIIQLPCQCILTISYLATIGRRRNKGFTAQIFIELTSKRIRTNEGVVYTVVLAPLLSLFKAHKASLIAILEVPNNLGTLTKLYFQSQNTASRQVLNIDIHTGNAGIVRSSKRKTIQCTSSIVRQRHLNVICIIIHVRFTTHRHDRQCNSTNSVCSGVRNHSRGSRKFKGQRIRDSNLLTANHFAICQHLDHYLTLRTIGSKHTICNSTKGFIGQCPSNIIGHFHSIAMGIDCFCVKGVDSLGCKDIILGFHIDYIQNTGGRNIGSNEDTMCSRTLCAVAGNGTHLKVLFANALGDEGGRTTAVTVGSPLTAQSQHGFAQLIVIEANRVVCATAIVHNQNQCAVFFNTDHRASSCVTSTRLSLCNQFAVHNSHSERNTNCMEQSAAFQISIEVRLVVCLHIAGDGAVLFLEYVQDGAGGRGFALHANALTVVHQNARCIGVIVQVSVHTADNVITQIIFIILGHFGQFLMRPIRLIQGILCQLIDLVITGNDRDIRVGGIDLDNVQHLSTGTSSIVQDDFGFHSSAGNQHVILFGDHVVITIGAKGSTFIHYILICPVGDGCKCRERNQTNEHRNRDHQGDYSDGCFSCHFNFSFS